MARLSRSAFVAGSGALAASLHAAPARAAYGDTPIAGSVTLAIVGPFTGDMSSAGAQLDLGVRAAVDDANQLHGTLDKLFNVRNFDDQNLLATGLQAAEFACDDQTVVCVIGHLSGRITDACLQTYVNHQMPVLVPASTYDPITSHGYGNVLRLPTKDSTEGRLTARSVETLLKPTSAVTMYQDGDYGYDVAAGFHNQLTNDKITSNAIGFSWKTPDFATVVKQTMALKPDVVYMAGLAKDMGPLLPALKAAGYTGALYASQGFFDPLTLQKYATAAEGLTISCSAVPLALAPSDFRIKQDYERKHGTLTPLAAYAYGAAQIAIATVRRTNAADRIAVERALQLVTTFNTMVGNISFQNDGDPQLPNVYYYTVKNGAWSYVRAAHPTDFILK